MNNKKIIIIASGITIISILVLVFQQQIKKYFIVASEDIKTSLYNDFNGLSVPQQTDEEIINQNIEERSNSQQTTIISMDKTTTAVPNTTVNNQVGNVYSPIEFEYQLTADNYNLNPTLYQNVKSYNMNIKNYNKNILLPPEERNKSIDLKNLFSYIQFVEKKIIEEIE